MAFDLKNPDNDFLAELNKLFRSILYQTRIDDIKTKFDRNDSEVFSQVMGIFWHYYDGSVSRRRLRK